MRRFRFWLVPLFVFVPLAALVFMALWNWLLPDLFGISVITYWQSLGLLVLLRLLIGPRFGFMFNRSFYWNGYRHRNHWRKRMYEKWKGMSEEEKEKFRSFYKHRYCGPNYFGGEETKTEEAAGAGS